MRSPADVCSKRCLMHIALAVAVAHVPAPLQAPSGCLCGSLPVAFWAELFNSMPAGTCCATVCFAVRLCARALGSQLITRP